MVVLWVLLIVPVGVKAMDFCLNVAHDPALWGHRVVLPHRSLLQKRLRELDLESFDRFAGLSYRLKGMQKNTVGAVIELIALSIDMYNNRVAAENAEIAYYSMHTRRVVPWQKGYVVQAMLKDQPLVLERLRYAKII